MNNLEIWNKYKEVPKNAMRAFSNGSFKGTDINTMWRLKSLTEQFGICGIGWYYDIIKIWNENCVDGEDNQCIMTFAEIKLYIKVDNEWSKGISGVGGNKMLSYVKKKDDGTGGYYKPNDEAVKMAVTDAIGVACRNLGFGADVYWENDKTKYTEFEKQKEDKPLIVGGKYKFASGKYAGKTIAEVNDTDANYLELLMSNEKVSKVIKDNIQEFLSEE